MEWLVRLADPGREGCTSTSPSTGTGTRTSTSAGTSTSTSTRASTSHNRWAPNPTLALLCQWH